MATETAQTAQDEVVEAPARARRSSPASAITKLPTASPARGANIADFFGEESHVEHTVTYNDRITINLVYDKDFFRPIHEVMMANLEPAEVARVYAALLADLVVSWDLKEWVEVRKLDDAEKPIPQLDAAGRRMKNAKGEPLFVMEHVEQVIPTTVEGFGRVPHRINVWLWSQIRQHMLPEGEDDASSNG